MSAQESQPRLGTEEYYSRNFQRITHALLQDRRNRGLPVSSSHAEPHLNGTADLIPIIGAAYGFSERENILGRLTGQLHDIERSSGEGSGGVEKSHSATVANLIMIRLDEKGLLQTGFVDRVSVMHAINDQGKPPDYFEDPNRREEIPTNLRDRLHAVLYIADGLQKLGAPLVARRSAYVGGERRGVKPNGEAGDLNGVMYGGKQVSAIQAVLLESAVRLGWRNVEELYPKRFADFIEPAFEIQRDWIAGLLTSQGLDMARWVELVWNSRDSNGRNIFDLAKKSVKTPPSTPQEVLSVLFERGRLNDERIDNARNNGDLMVSAVEAVEYFSASWQNPDQAKVIEGWNPQGEHAKMWKKGM